MISKQIRTVTKLNTNLYIWQTYLYHI